MIRRQVSLGLLVLVCGLLLTGTGTGPGFARAQAALPPAYRAAADWLFDLYARQSVRLSVANALRQRPPGTESILEPTLPVMVKNLERHREAFASAMMAPLQGQFDAAALAALLASARASPPALDEAQRRKLFEVDAEFRREQQTIVRAMTLDIGLMIAATLSEQGQSR